ncbi:MAG: hypothetical protein GY733_15775, partial [bacterium]|nr:hypothetical protein [bacterium]
TRSIRTSVTTLIVVLIQFFFNRGSGSVLEGFAFVMVIGVICGTYSSIFIAAPLLLFVPVFWGKFAAKPNLAWGQVVLTLIGVVLAIGAEGHGVRTYVGLLLTLNIPIRFMLHFIPWMGHPDPDSLLEAEIQAEEDLRPLTKPGI